MDTPQALSEDPTVRDVITICPKGWYCKGNDNDKKLCPAGKYCPLASSNLVQSVLLVFSVLEVLEKTEKLL